MSVKKVKRMSRPTRVVSKRRAAREEEAPAEVYIPPPQAPQGPGIYTRKERVDPLLAVVQKREEDLKVSSCAHPHLRFKQMGVLLTCIDCPGTWHKVTAPGLMLDMTYFHPNLHEMETRHTPYEAPRVGPKPAPVAAKKK